MKRIVSLLLAMMLVVAMAAGAMAATVTLPTGLTNHTFEAYQIFKGTQAESETALGDVEWGSGIKSAEFLAALQADTTLDDAFDTCTTAAEVAEKLASYGDYSDEAKLFAKYADEYKSDDCKKLSAGENTLDDGYYLIVDTTMVSGQDDAKNTALLQVTRDITIESKIAKPTVDKQVWDENDDAEAGAVDGWGESADHEMNESFQFKLVAKLSADTDYAAYETYKIVFNDTMSAGITFEKIDSVVVDGVPLTEDQYTHTATANQAGGSWSLTIEDLKAIANVDLNDGAVVEVIYSAHLNENAVVASNDDNQNKVYLQYSNNPNAGGEGELGKTTEDIVYVFTYEFDVNKVDGAENTKVLAGAEFKLQNAEKEWATFDTNGKLVSWVDTEEDGTALVTNNDGKITITGLDAGIYYLKETKAPAGYNILLDPITVTIEATHVENDNKVSATDVYTVNEATDITVENNKGSVLPETGGMGTTMMYIAGGLLVAAAVVLLIAKRRANAAE